MLDEIYAMSNQPVDDRSNDQRDGDNILIILLLPLTVAVLLLDVQTLHLLLQHTTFRKLIQGHVYV